MPVKTGLVAPATARATTSVSKAARSARAPPPRTMAMTSQSLRLSTVSGTGDRRRRPGPLHADRHERDVEAEARARQLAEEVLVALGPRAGDQPDVQRDLGHAAATALRREQALGLERAQQLGPLGGHAPQQRGDVDLGEDEADLALGPVEVERAPQHDDHPLGELDALLGQPVPQRRPRAAPALDVERGHAAPGAGAAGAPSSSGSTRSHVEVARAVVRDVLDLAAHPELAVAGKGRVQCALDLLVEAADGEDPAAVRRARRRRTRSGCSEAAASGGASGSKS